MTLVVFGLTYLFLAIGKVPGLRTDRAGIALIGAASMLCVGLVGFDEAFSPMFLDYKVIVLLFGLMVLVGVLRLEGLFERLESLLDVGSSRRLLALTIGLGGALSAFLVNDIICVAFTPLVLGQCRRRGYNPLPHLIGLAMASNLGSAAAITGNPQNMYIGINSGISYLRFMAKLGPVAVLSLGLAYLLITWIYGNQLAGQGLTPEASDENKRILRSIPVMPTLIAVVAVLLFFSLPTTALPLVALGAAAVSTMSRTPPGKLFAQVDWPLLVLFAGLFIVVGGFRKHVLPIWGVTEWAWLRDEPLLALSGLSVVLSNLVSNVPAVMLFKDVIAAMPEDRRETAWLALSLSSTLAGNLTVLGSVANLIVVEGARREGVNVSFMQYARVGVPLTLLTLVIGIGWLALMRY